MGMLVSPVTHLTVALISAAATPVALWGGKKCVQITMNDTEKTDFQEKTLNFGFIALVTIGILAGLLCVYSSTALMTSIVFEACASPAFSHAVQVGCSTLSGFATGLFTFLAFKQVFFGIDIWNNKKI